MKTNIIKIATLVLGLMFAWSSVAQGVVDTLEIASNQSQKVQGGTVINHLIVNADKMSSGELIIESGVVQVKQMTYRFQLKPAEWTMISVPSDIKNLDDANVSNLSVLGLKQNTGIKRYLIKKYDSEARSNSKEPWTQISTAELIGGNAYLIYVSTGSTDLFDLELYFDNMTLNSNSVINNVLVDIDLTDKAVLQTYNMQIKAKNIKANTLDVSVFNEPQNVVIPVNHAEALKDALIIFTEDKAGMRITLPDSETSKVLITDRKMKRVLKAVEYVSPAVIPTDGLKRGTYNAIIEYGSAMEIKSFKIK